MHCLTDSFNDVRQSAFALTGECFKSCPSVLRNNLHDFFKEVIGNVDMEETMVSNNAVWAIGEAAGAYGRDAIGVYLEPSVKDVLIEMLNTIQDVSILNIYILLLFLYLTLCFSIVVF